MTIGAKSLKQTTTQKRRNETGQASENTRSREMTDSAPITIPMTYAMPRETFRFAWRNGPLLASAAFSGPKRNGPCRPPGRRVSRCAGASREAPRNSRNDSQMALQAVEIAQNGLDSPPGGRPPGRHVSDPDDHVRSTASGDYSSPGDSRSLRLLLNLARPSPAKQRSSMAQIGSSGTGSALLAVAAEADAGVELSESGGGGKSPRSRTGWVGSDAVWPIAPCGPVRAARASAAPSANDNPTMQTIIFADKAWLGALSRRR
jgi:hypothetical protein